MKGYSTVDEENISQKQNEYSESIMDKFPELKLCPSSLLSKKEGAFATLFKKRIRKYIVICLFLCVAVILFYLLIDPGENWYVWFWTFLGAVGFSLMISCIVESKWENRYNKLKKEIDYFQIPQVDCIIGNSYPYIIVIKNSKFGVWKIAECRFIIQPTYDCLSWKNYGRLLNAQKHGVSFVADITGKRLY